MKKVLFTASIVGHFASFHMPYLQHFKDRGFEVHTAARGEKLSESVDHHFDIAFDRSPLSLKNIWCYRALKKIIDQNGYDIIHCHTPVVSVLTRLAARKARKKGTCVIYTAHGFYFYHDAPRLSGTLFRQLEKTLCRWTNILITINQEDYDAIGTYHFKPGASFKVPGVGVDASRFSAQTPESKKESRLRYEIGPDAFVLIFAAEYSHRKNQKMLIEAVRLLKERIPQILLLLPGEGPLRGEYEDMISTYGLTDHVRLLGFRRDMDQLLETADIAVSSSVHEGLPINIIEAMAVSLPVVASRVRGHIDLIEDGENGFLVDLGDYTAMAERLLFLYENRDVLDMMRSKVRTLAEPYFLENAKVQTFNIYDTVIKEKESR